MGIGYECFQERYYKYADYLLFLNILLYLRYTVIINSEINKGIK